MTRRDPLYSAAVRLMHEIDHQVTRPGVTIPSKCIECGEAAVDGGCCPQCLCKGLGYIVGSAVARQYLTAVIQLRDARSAVIQTTVRGA